jgi:serine/threonine protein kinase
MGEVYRARDSKLQRDVAVKVLPERLAGNDSALARFEREARIVAALSHPNILAIHDRGQEGATAYAVMELLDGQSLREELHGGPLPPRKAAAYAAQAAEALAAAHERGIVHRDLKPENLFVTRDGRLKVLDFGLARQEPPTGVPLTSESPTLVRQTDPGTVIGTVGYMSPEQVRGEAVDHRSDVFSLGCVLYEMLSGRQRCRRDDDGHPARGHGSARGGGPRDPSGARADRGALPGEEARRALPVGAGPGLRSREPRGLLGPLARRGVQVVARRLEALGTAAGALLLVGFGYLIGPRRLRPATPRPSRASGSPSSRTCRVSNPRPASPPTANARLRGPREGRCRRLRAALDQPHPGLRQGRHPLLARRREDRLHSECEGGGVFVMGATGEARRGGRVGPRPGVPAAEPGRRERGSTRCRATPRACSPSWTSRPARRGACSTRTRCSRWSPADAGSPTGGSAGARAGPAGGTSGRSRPTAASRSTSRTTRPSTGTPSGRPTAATCTSRAGTLNLWRVPIDAASGRPLGARSPRRPASGGISLSHTAPAWPSGPSSGVPRSTVSPSIPSAAAWPERRSSCSADRARSPASAATGVGSPGPARDCARACS